GGGCCACSGPSRLAARCGCRASASARWSGCGAGPPTARGRRCGKLDAGLRLASMSERDDVLVVGGGVIGLASALALLDAGRSVRVREANTAGCGSSHGNCGTITPSHAAPLTAPGKIGKALHWMLTPDAPFYVKPRYDPGLWRWMLRFAARCNVRDWREAMTPRAAILLESREQLARWVERYGLQCEFAELVVDYVFHTRRELDHLAAELPPLAEVGVAGEVIDGPLYLRDEPALREGVVGVVRFP